jgi:hypothetical protein
VYGIVGLKTEVEAIQRAREELARIDAASRSE